MSNNMKIETFLTKFLQYRNDKVNFGIGIENVVGVNVIASYLRDEQEVFNSRVLITPINNTTSEQLSVEKEILLQVIDDIQGNLKELVEISLCFYVPFETEEELISNGYGFMFRTNGKYNFRASERGEFEEDIINTLDICNYLV